MKQKNGKIALVAKVLGGIMFLAVFIFNGMAIVENDANGFSLSTLKAYAQSGGTGNEEEGGSGTGKKEASLVQCGLKPFVKTVYYKCTMGYDPITKKCLYNFPPTQVGMDLVEGGVVKSTYYGPFDSAETTSGTTPSNLVQGWVCRSGGTSCIGIDVTGCNPCDGQICPVI